MDISQSIISEFAHTFTGNEYAYGIHVVADSPSIEATGKVRGKMDFTKTSPITDEVYEAHLNGRNGLGVIPLRQDGTVSFSVIDIDKYDTQHVDTINMISNSGLPMIPFRSKSGGLHLYVFYSERTLASKSIEMLNKIKVLMGLPAKTEVFPKQAKIKEGEIGNWINLPYYNAVGKCVQYAIGLDGKPMDLEDALRTISAKKTTLAKMEDALDNLPLSDAPPCLQCIYFRKTTDNRNNYLFNMAVYYKASVGDKFEESVVDANRLLDNPIDNERLNDTVLKSARRKTYTYKCAEEPICSLCNKSECAKRKYGIGGSEVTQMDFGELVQVTTEPPYYEWLINGKKLKFFDENEIIKQDTFQKLCMRSVHILPQTLSKPVWTTIVNNALKNIVVKEVTSENDCSPGSMFMELLTEFLTKRAPAQNRTQIQVDRVYRDDEYTIAGVSSPSYIFRLKNLLTFLTITNSFRAYTTTQIHERLTHLGAFTARYIIGAAGTARVWVLPVKSLEKFTDDANQEVVTSFLDEPKSGDPDFRPDMMPKQDFLRNTDKEVQY